MRRGNVVRKGAYKRLDVLPQLCKVVSRLLALLQIQTVEPTIEVFRLVFGIVLGAVIELVDLFKNVDIGSCDIVS